MERIGMLQGLERNFFFFLREEILYNEYWSGLRCPSGDLPDPGIEPMPLNLSCLGK